MPIRLASDRHEITSKVKNTHWPRIHNGCGQGPRRAFKVTCAIRFSKSETQSPLPPGRKKRTGNLASDRNEVKRLFFGGLFPCSARNICRHPNPVNPAPPTSPPGAQNAGKQKVDGSLPVGHPAGTSSLFWQDAWRANMNCRGKRRFRRMPSSRSGSARFNSCKPLQNRDLVSQETPES